jgi:phosphoglycerate dehydrogenase-like enzyme
VDEDALYDAVASGALAGAALDVFKAEPYTPYDSARDLRTLERVLMTPHIGSSTTEACDRMARAALENIANALAGRVDAMSLIPAVLA